MSIAADRERWISHMRQAGDAVLIDVLENPDDPDGMSCFGHACRALHSERRIDTRGRVCYGIPCVHDHLLLPVDLCRRLGISRDGQFDRRVPVGDRRCMSLRQVNGVPGMTAARMATIIEWEFIRDNFLPHFDL